MKKQRNRHPGRRKRTRAEQKARAAQSIPWTDRVWTVRRDEKNFLVDTFYSIENTIIRVVEEKLPEEVSPLEEFGGDTREWTRDIMRIAANALDESGLMTEAISSIANGGAEAVLPILDRAIEKVKVPWAEERANRLTQALL